MMIVVMNTLQPKHVNLKPKQLPVSKIELLSKCHTENEYRSHLSEPSKCV